MAYFNLGRTFVERFTLGLKFDLCPGGQCRGIGLRSRDCARMHSPDSEAHTNTSKSSSCHCPVAIAPHCAWDPLQIQFPALPQARLPRTCQRLSERPNLPHAALRRTVAVAVTHSPVIESWKRKTIRSCNRDGLWLEGRTGGWREGRKDRRGDTPGTPEERP